MESQSLLGCHTSLNNNICSTATVTDEEWTEDSSNSSCSDSDSTIPEWEPYVDDYTGELLYIECHPFVVQNKDTIINKVETSELVSKSNLRRSTRGKFLKLLRRRDSKRKSKKNHKSIDICDTNTSKVKFQELHEGEEKEVMLKIDTENRHNLSTDKSLAESLLGLIVSTLSDGNRVMIAGFSYDSKAKQERNIKIGDWLKSINNIEVNVQNLDDILQKFINRDDVLLKLQRVAGIEVTKNPPINELNIESEFVRELLNSKSDDEQTLLQTLCKHPVGIVYINTDKLNENNQNNEDVCYCYPRPMQTNILVNSRGMFITLNHLLHDLTNSTPRVTTVKYNGQLTNIVFTNIEEKNLLFLMLPDNTVSQLEITLVNKEIIRFFQFCYDTVDQSFTAEKYTRQVDQFFSKFFARILNGGLWSTAQQFVALESLDSKVNEVKPFQFEDIMLVTPTLCLPDEAQIQIDDALSELEASDYRDWNEEPLDCQRLFTVLGSALFHGGYLLASHFIHEDLIDVYCFCKQQGLFYLSKTEPVKTLVLWKEVFPSSCRKFENANVKFPDGKRYLLVVESGKDLLAVLMESGGCTELPEKNIGPDAFYVEEAQATLAHIQELGLGELAERILSLDLKSPISKPILQSNRKRSDFINLNFSKGSLTTGKDTLTLPKKNEVISILKKRNSDTNFTSLSNSSNSLQDEYDRQSEGSGSQGGYSEISDDSRKKFRKEMKYDSNDEESDTDEYGESSHVSVSSFCISEMRQYILSEIEDFQPIQLTAGNENVYHYIQLNISEGILLCPPEASITSLTFRFVMNNFRKRCLRIHSLFENTLRFKNLPTQDIAKSFINKSLIAIKEHGVLFECFYIDDHDSKKSKIRYWVLGRLFYMPHPKELYVCYQDGIPQNLIEIAFNINMRTAT